MGVGIQGPGFEKNQTDVARYDAHSVFASRPPLPAFAAGRRVFFSLPLNPDP